MLEALQWLISNNNITIKNLRIDCYQRVRPLYMYFCFLKQVCRVALAVDRVKRLRSSVMTPNRHGPIRKFCPGRNLYRIAQHITARQSIMESECSFLMDNIREPLQRFIQRTLDNSTNLTTDAFIRVNVSLHQPNSLGVETRIVEQTILVRAVSQRLMQ